MRNKLVAIDAVVNVRAWRVNATLSPYLDDTFFLQLKPEYCWNVPQKNADTRQFFVIRRFPQFEVVGKTCVRPAFQY